MCASHNDTMFCSIFLDFVQQMARCEQSLQQLCHHALCDRMGLTAMLSYQIAAGTCNRMIATLEGIHPTFRQVPPRAPLPSTQATFNPICPALIAATYPPGPPPMTIRSCITSRSLLGSHRAGTVKHNQGRVHRNRSLSPSQYTGGACHGVGTGLV